jgi:glycerate 2-kinase
MTPIADPRAFLTSLFDAAVKAADPRLQLASHLPPKPKGRTIVVGAGKAASQMAAALEAVWDGPLSGIVVARHGPVEPTTHIKVLTAAHPVPDQSGLMGSQALFDAVHGLSADDLVIALISGGGSSLLPCPPEGLTLDDEIAVNRALLSSGAPISAMNTVRKHVSQIKGGRLALAAHPAKVVTFIISDIPGDNPAFVASGPTIPDDSTPQHALEIIRLYKMDLPDAVMEHLQSPKAIAPNPSDTVFARNEVHIIASANVSLEAAAREAERQGIVAHILSDLFEGEAREVGQVHAALSREARTRNRPFAVPCVILSGGETTVTISGKDYGKGGRNTEFLLSFALGIEGMDNIHALAADTDGIDGSEDNAGAFCDGDTTARTRHAGHDPKILLAGHDAWTAFNSSGDLFVPGPTGTNVNDFRAILILK